MTHIQQLNILLKLTDIRKKFELLANQLNKPKQNDQGTDKAIPAR